MSSRAHLVFAGPGRLPSEIGKAFTRRPAEPDAIVLLAAVADASTAERLADHLQTMGIDSAVAGPEQPAPTEGWLLASALRVQSDGWSIETQRGERHVASSAVTRVTIVHWHTRETVERAILLRVPSCEWPLLLHERRLGLGHNVPSLMSNLLEDVGTANTTTCRVRERRLAAADFEALADHPDGILVALWAVDLLDPTQARLPARLTQKAKPPAAVDLWPGPWVATALHLASLAALALALGVTATIATGSVSYLTSGLFLAVALAAWGSRRLAWAHWLRLATHRASLWPMTDSAAGTKPGVTGCAIDLIALSTAASAWSSQPPFDSWSRAALAGLLGGALLTGAAIRSCDDELGQ